VRARNGRASSLFLRPSDETRLLQCCSDEAGEERVRLERPALQLRMELDADEPRMVGALDDLGQLIVRGHSGEYQAGAFQCVLVMDVDLVAVAMPLADLVLAVDAVHDAVAV